MNLFNYFSPINIEIVRIFFEKMSIFCQFYLTRKQNVQILVCLTLIVNYFVFSSSTHF
jgi:hypothetical protein